MALTVCVTKGSTTQRTSNQLDTTVGSIGVITTEGIMLQNYRDGPISTEGIILQNYKDSPISTEGIVLQSYRKSLWFLPFDALIIKAHFHVPLLLVVFYQNTQVKVGPLFSLRFIFPHNLPLQLYIYLPIGEE
jgi:hypothetical protein